jgi:drug/metabolite transporter (DMT)-like permease
MNGVLFALISLAMAGLNDLLFKRQARSAECGRYMAIVGVVWTGVFSAAAIFSQAAPTTSSLLWGLLAGSFSALANYLLILSLRKLDASVGATIYRLNMVPAAILALLFLGEELSPYKALGLALGCLAVLVIQSGGRRERRHGGIEPALLLAITASLLRALMGITYKLAASAQREWFLAAQGPMWIGVGLMTRPRGKSRAALAGPDIFLALASGILICGNVFSFSWATQLGDASVVIPISQMSFIVTTLLAQLLMKERMTASKALAIALALAAVLFLSMG